MEELQEADVLWPETPPPTPASYPPELHEAAGFSFEPFGSEPAASSSSSTSSASSAPPFGLGSSDGFLSDVPSTFAGGHGGDDASFQEADVLWPDDGYATRERGVDGGTSGGSAAASVPMQPAAAPRSPARLGVNAERGGRRWCRLRSISIPELPSPLAVVRSVGMD